MIVHCPNCGKQLKLSDKISESIQGLEAGRKLKLKCVHCAVPFALDAGTVNEVAQTGSTRSGVRPPAAPNLSWLREGVFEEQEVVEDVPRALVLFPDTPQRQVVVEAVEAFGYLVDQLTDPREAIDRMPFVNYAGVFLHSGFEPGGLGGGRFHRFMRDMAMSRRRTIFYVLVGGEFETLYDLQALACSANLVVNDREIPYIGTILRKAIPEYDKLFGPLLEELQVAGK